MADIKIPVQSSCPAGPLVELGMVVQQRSTANYESNNKPYQFRLVVKNPENPRQSLKLFYDRDYQFVAAHTRTWRGLEAGGAGRKALEVLRAIDVGCISVYDDRSEEDKRSVAITDAILDLISSIANPVSSHTDTAAE